MRWWLEGGWRRRRTGGRGRVVGKGRRMLQTEG